MHLQYLLMICACATSFLLSSSVLADIARTPEGRPDFQGVWTNATETPLERPAGERCILSVLSTDGPPMFPMSYNSNYRIVQTPKYLMILSEMVNDTRIIRINGEHQPEVMRKWMGDSVARWQGDALVVTTRNIHTQQSFRGSTGNLTTTQWFSMTPDGQITYRVTLDEPEVFGQTWTAKVPLRRLPAGRDVYEYACHEGNYSIVGALAGARWQQHYQELENEAEAEAEAARNAQ